MSGTPRKEPVVITSSKSNIAHGEGGAVLLDSSNAACRLLGGKPWKPPGRYNLVFLWLGDVENTH